MRTQEKLTYDHLVEALTETRGFIYAAKKYIKRKFDYDVCYQTINSRIKEWEMQDWLDDQRKSLVEDCMQKAFHKGIADGDNHCLFWVMDKYGHHVNFLDGKDSETESKKGWKVLLDYIKNAPESETNTECKK